MRSLKGGIGEIVSKLGKRMVVGLALKVSGDRPDEVFAAACKLGWYISTTATISKDYCLALSLSLSHSPVFLDGETDGAAEAATGHNNDTPRMK
jgi:hypothetical protein